MVSEQYKRIVRDKITEHSRDYLKLDITLPLGDTALKKVHTNQWLWTVLPKEFALRNWETIASVLNSNNNRYGGYVKNRWYIEGVEVSNDVNGKAEMKLNLNAFPSSLSSYSDAYMQFIENGNDNSSSSNSKKSNKNVSKAVTTKSSVINDKWVKKYNVPSKIVEIIKKVCSVKKSDYDNVYAWYRWMDNNVGYDKYYGHQKDMTTVINTGKGNCVDNSRVFRAGCHALGIKCNYVQGYSCCADDCANHQWNKVYIGNKSYTVDCGRSLASWGSHWGSCSGGSNETTSGW